MKSFKNFLKESVNSADSKEALLKLIEKLKKVKVQKGNFVWDFKGTKSVIRFKFLGKAKDDLLKELKAIDASYSTGKFFGDRDCIQYEFDDGSVVQFVPSGGQVGSSGNSGHQFERDFAEALKVYFENPKADVKFKDAIQHIETIIKTKFPKERVVNIKSVGELNQKREIALTNKGLAVKGSLNIGNTVTDITIEMSGNKNLYLSLKVGDAKFLNKGIKDIVPDNEMKLGKIQNKLGQAFLNQMGINNEWFCESYNAAFEKRKQHFNIPRETEFKGDINGVKNLVKAAIGFGYLVVKKDKGSSKVDVIDLLDEQSLNHEVANIRNFKVLYPAMGSGSKTVSLKCETRSYKLAFVIRNRNSGVYPNSVDLNYQTKSH